MSEMEQELHRQSPREASVMTTCCSEEFVCPDRATSRYRVQSGVDFLDHNMKLLMKLTAVLSAPALALR